VSVVGEVPPEVDVSLGRGSGLTASAMAALVDEHRKNLSGRKCDCDFLIVRESVTWADESSMTSNLPDLCITMSSVPVRGTKTT